MSSYENWNLFARIGLHYNETFFRPVDVLAYGNWFFRALIAAAGTNIFGIHDDIQLRHTVYLKLLLCYDSENGESNVKKIFDALHEKDGDSLTAYISTHRQNGVWVSELDASLISYVFEVNIIIISNVVRGCKVFNSLKKLIDAAVCGELPTNQTLWVYLYRYGDPMNPGPCHVLNHFCALVPKVNLSLDEIAVAYMPGTKMVPVKTSRAPQFSTQANATAERNKKKRKRLNMQQKQRILDAVEKGTTQKDVANHFGICQSAIFKIIKNRQRIEDKIRELKDRGVKLTRKRIVVTSNYPFKDIYRATFTWLSQVRANATQLNVTGDMIMLKASRFAKMLNVAEQVSGGWLRNFLAQYGVTSVRRCREKRSFEITDSMKARIEYIKHHISDFAIEDVLNADKTALFYETVSSRTYKVASEDSKNTKRSKERITALVCVAASGKLFDLQVLHTAKRP